MLDWIDQLDRSVLMWINQSGTPNWDPFWILVTRPETWIPLYILFLFLIFWSNNAKKGLQTLLSLILVFALSLLLTDLVKLLVGRVRPNNALIEGLRILQHPTDYGFFSGHASTSFALSTILYLQLRDRWRAMALVFIWPLLFVSSRLFVGVHYPSDILAGALFGIFIGWLSHRFFSWLRDRHAAGPISQRKV